MWHRVDPIIYRQGSDLASKQSPDIHVEKGWVSELNGFATSLAYAGVALMALMLGTYAFAIGTTLYRWYRLEKMNKYWWSDIPYRAHFRPFGANREPSEG
jgi:hypothetical protein